MLPRLRSAALLLAVAGALSFPSLARADGEKEVKATEVPKAVSDAVAKRYPGAKVTRWSTETEDKATIYEARLEITTKDKDKKDVVRVVEASLSAEGKLLAEEEDLKADALPAEVKKAIADGKYAKAKITGASKESSGEKLEVVHYEVKFQVEGKTIEVTYDAAGKVLEEEGPEEGEGGGDMK